MGPNSVILAISLASAAGLLVSAWLLLRSHSPVRGFARDWRSVDVARYRPMLRLLQPADLQYPFVAAPVAGDIAARLRRRHVEIFRAYLRALQADFTLLQDAGHQLVASGAASPALAENLFRSKLEFSRNLWLIRLRLLGFRLGIHAIDARPLLDAVQRAQRVLQPVAAAA